MKGSQTVTVVCWPLSPAPSGGPFYCGWKHDSTCVFKDHRPQSLWIIMLCTEMPSLFACLTGLANQADAFGLR